MNINVRSEKISDYNSIANVIYEAFSGISKENEYISEPILVDLLRHNSIYDPELSLVAEVDGKVAGYALFSPFRFIVSGVEQLGVVLAPLAVKPEFQNKGVGSALIEEGHRIAKKKGFAFSLLCGHEKYYPKFGYKTAMFSMSGVRVSISRKDFDSKGFSERRVRESDISLILKSWNREYSSASLALFPGESIIEWSSHFAKYRCSIIEKDNRILGYVRVADSKILSIRELLADSNDIPDILAYLAWKKYGSAEGKIDISQPEEKFRMYGSVGFNVTDKRAGYNAFMIKVFDHNSPIADYCENVEKGLIKPGIISFPAMFDVD